MTPSTPFSLTKDNFQLIWNPQTDESYIKIVEIDSMSRDYLIKQILSALKLQGLVKTHLDKYLNLSNDNKYSVYVKESMLDRATSMKLLLDESEK